MKHVIPSLHSLLFCLLSILDLRLQSLGSSPGGTLKIQYYCRIFFKQVTVGLQEEGMSRMVRWLCTDS